MHRSGTSLVAKVLEKGGIFMGVLKDHNYEAVHFLSENQKALEAAGGNWMYPLTPSKEHWTNFDAPTLHHQHFLVNGRLQKLRLKLRNPKWGFKDPRNTFTLNMWLHFYPNAKVIHVFRNGDKVAASLKKRNTVPGEVYDEQLDSLVFNLSLWEKYVKQARSYKTTLNSNYIEVDYDQLISLDKQAIEELETFTKCDLSQLFKKYVR